MAEWHEFPLWVPVRDGHLAAVLTVPSGRPRGLVALLPEGGGAPRSHRHRVWTRTARALAEHELASIRFDYPHVGDSTGNPRVEWESPPVQEAMAAVQVGIAVTGVSKVATVGNCLGAQTALAIALRMDVCRAIVVFVQGDGDLVRPPRQCAAGAVERMFPRMPVKPLLRRMARWPSLHRRPTVPRLTPAVEAAINSQSCLFLLLGGETRARRFEGLINSAMTDPDVSRGRVETRRVPVGMQGFRLPSHLQSQVIGEVVKWLDRTLR